MIPDGYQLRLAANNGATYGEHNLSPAAFSNRESGSAVHKDGLRIDTMGGIRNQVERRSRARFASAPGQTQHTNAAWRKFAGQGARQIFDCQFHRSYIATAGKDICVALEEMLMMTPLSRTRRPAS